MKTISTTELADKASEFEAAKEAYTDQRNWQRQLIADYLKQQGMYVRIAGRAGRGSKTYTAHGTLKAPYDLSNWMWVEVLSDEKDADKPSLIISLQSPDMDPETKNKHVLMDRICITMCPTTADGPDRLLLSTGFTLPLDEAALQDISEMAHLCMKSMGVGGGRNAS